MFVNGKELSLTTLQNPSLSGLLQHLGVKETTVAIEHNGEIIERGGWENIVLQAKDRIEVIKFVGGG
ncbi:MAG: sulfur carrier protein ThiS [Spirochaetota bacterium]